MKTNPRIHVIGDSISVGYGPFLEKELGPGIAIEHKSGREDALRNLDLPDGANNGDSRACRRYLEERITAGDFRPDLVLFNCGLHDLKTDRATGQRQVAPDAYRANLEAMAHLLRDAGLSAAWVRITPVNESVHNVRKPFLRFEADVALYNRLADEVMAAAGIPVLDLYTFTETQPWRPLSGDGVHFTEDVQQAQAAYLAARLRDLLKTGG
jgi:lysophospholipase L1-like esterase